ncbi:MAG: N-6 DNA methylase [Armatimonadetes bacterium]|nr:N-6 DNA methylase [Armatimonadota bacterium]
MKAFEPYVKHLEDLADKTSAGSHWDDIGVRCAIEAALDGEPAEQLRCLVSLDQLRKSGAFFTGSSLARRAVKLLAGSLTEHSIVLDPACGAGDLLIAVASHLPTKQSLPETLACWGRQIVARDLHIEFTGAARIRLAFAALLQGDFANNAELPQLEDAFPLVGSGCGLADEQAIRMATHIVVNPPFTLTDAPKECLWASGKVSAAAIFLEACVLKSKPGTRIAAILPDVLRSGTRYRKWREAIAARTRLNRIQVCGQFDRWADVDVFILDVETTNTSDTTETNSWYQPSTRTVECVKNRFDVSVGPVVSYRDAHTGIEHPFVCARALPRWSTVRIISNTRRYSGRVLEPPFVVVRRTSRLGDAHRAIGTIVQTRTPVAVENHLLVLVPKDGTLRSCRDLLGVLQDEKTTRWLNQRIRCRHLTVSALAELPWWE